MTKPDGKKPTVDLLTPGDRAPNFLLPDQRDLVISIYNKITGGPVVALFYPENRDPGSAAELRRLFELAPEIVAAGGHVFTVGDESVAALQHLPGRQAGDVWLVCDPQRRAAADWGTRGALVGFVCDANMRVVATLKPGRTPIADRALAAVRERPRAAPAPMPAHPPILVIENLIDRDFCRYLIDRFEHGAAEESGTFRMIDGKMIKAPNHDAKRRHDLYATGKLHEEIANLVGRRVLAEIRRAFHSNSQFVEEFKIVRYSADPGGYFRPHRDNTTPGTAHRRFAMTLNLNSEEYEGGELRFPEYGNASYKPATGSAAVFSCNLLHEATDVLTHHRYVLLSFLYDESGRQQLERYRQIQARQATR
jgi:peroxiredoxin/predicted 2-oxoglutarate/Fe(II)-dependent dioxygenase YbiX